MLGVHETLRVVGMALWFCDRRLTFSKLPDAVIIMGTTPTLVLVDTDAGVVVVTKALP